MTTNQFLGRYIQRDAASGKPVFAVGEGGTGAASDDAYIISFVRWIKPHISPGQLYYELTEYPLEQYYQVREAHSFGADTTALGLPHYTGGGLGTGEIPGEGWDKPQLYNPTGFLISPQQPCVWLSSIHRRTVNSIEKQYWRHQVLSSYGGHATMRLAQLYEPLSPETSYGARMLLLVHDDGDDYLYVGKNGHTLSPGSEDFFRVYWDYLTRSFTNMLARELPSGTVIFVIEQPGSWEYTAAQGNNPETWQPVNRWHVCGVPPC